MSRIPYPNADTLSEAKRAVIANPGGRLLNVSRMAMHAPDAQWAAQRALGQASAKTKTIEPRLKEYAILLVAYLSNSAYELHHHKSIAHNLGIGENVFEALRVQDFSRFSLLERAVCQFVLELVRNVSPTDETLATLRTHLSDERIFEFVFLVGSYMTTARVAAVGGVELDEEPVKSWG